MNITLFNGFYVDVDSRQNHTLKQKYIGTKKDGTRKESVKPIGHYGNLRSAVVAALRINQVPPEAKLSVDLMGYVKMVEESNERAVQAIMKLVEGEKTDE